MDMQTRITKAGGLLALAVGCCLLAAAPASAATPGELLEKAIYTEETVGNIEEAMKLYQQVIAEGKTAQVTAARAQYRLAMCYQKKGQQAEARAAFQAVVDNFPTATDLVAEARKHLNTDLGLLKAPWKLGERMQLDMKLATGMSIGTTIYMIDAADKTAGKDGEAGEDVAAGQDILRCGTRQLVMINGATGFSEVYCHAESFAPIRSLWKHSLLGEAITTYSKTSAKVEVVGKDREFTIDFTPPAFDNEQCVELFRRLPLAEGYKTTFTVVTSLGGSQLALGIEVPGKETITVPAGTFDCYKVVLNIGQTFWISADEHRYVVRFAAGGVSADLARVWQVQPGEAEQCITSTFSLTLPYRWLAYEPKPDADADASEVVLLDPRAVSEAEVNVRPKSSLAAAEQASPQAWTESFVKGMKNKLADFALDESGIVETEVGGKPAAQIVANFTESGKPYRMLGVAVIGDPNAAVLRFTAPVDKFDSLRKDFDAIVSSFQFK
jgi:hypothetical protein